MPINDYKMRICTALAFMTAGNEYAYTVDNVVNFGVTEPDLGKDGKFGAHLVITTTFATTMTSCEIWIVHGSGATPTTKLTGRYFAIADMPAGAHLYIPCAPGLLQYASIYGLPTGGNPGTGNLTAWFGPDSDGAD